MNKIERIKDLINKFNGDSKKISKDAEEDLCKEISMILDSLYNIAKSYEEVFWSEYFCPNSGEISIDYADESAIEISYRDFWSYGGSCSLQMTIIISEFFSSSYSNNRKKEYKERKIKKLKNEKRTLEDRLKTIEELLIKYDN